jgi:hypothetical protein
VAAEVEEEELAGGLAHPHRLLDLRHEQYYAGMTGESERRCLLHARHDVASQCAFADLRGASRQPRQECQRTRLSSQNEETFEFLAVGARTVHGMVLLSSLHTM